MASGSKADGFKRTILVTGSTDGIGKQAVFELAARQKENFVIVHGRSKEKCEATIDYIVKGNNLPNRSNLDYIVADFSELKEVVRMTEEIEKRFPNLNVLLCNAGVLEPRRTESRNGLELTFQVNHLAPYILARKLVPLLKSNAPSRIIFVSSICYNWHELDWKDMESKNDYEKYVQYSRSKLMVHMTAFKLARLLEGSGVTSNVLEPGVIETKLLRNGGYHGAPVTEGSRPLVFLAESDGVANTNGAYFDNKCKRVTNLSADSIDVKQQERLWEFTEKLCEQYGCPF